MPSLRCDSHRRCVFALLHIGTRYGWVARGPSQISIQEQRSSSITAGAVFQALAFVAVVTVHACVVGAQQEFEPRQQQFHVQCTN